MKVLVHELCRSLDDEVKHEVSVTVRKHMTLGGGR
jgi:hypothetical protein